MKRNTYVHDINCNSIYEGDSIFYIVQRCSSSSSTWGQITNKKDGYYKIHGTIEFKHNQFYIVGNPEEIQTLKKPQDKEQFDREVWFDEIALSMYMQNYYGKEFGKGYIEKVKSRKKKKININSRLEALGVA